MTKSLKILLIILCFLFIAVSPVQAINMNLSDNTGVANTLTNNTINDNVSNTLPDTSDLFDTPSSTSPSTSTSNSSTSTSVSYLSSLPEADLGLNNILNILLIVIGILLILLGIAIIIRLK